MARAGKNSLVFVSATGKTLTAVATTAADGLTFQVAATSAQGEPFDPLASLTVATSSGGTVSSTGYTLYRPNGSVVFPTSSTNAYTITGTYLPTAQIAAAHGFFYKITADVADVSVLGAAWRSKLQTKLDVSGSVDDYHTDLTLGNLVTSSSQPICLTFYQASTASFDARAYGFLDADAIKSAVDGVVDGTVSFSGSADANGRAISFSTRGAG